MSQRKDAASRIAIVTGAGRGLGRDLARQLVTKGLRVAALGRTPESLESLAAEQAAGAVLPVPVDVSDADALRAAFAHIDEALGPVDLLINNAAVYPRRDFLDETPESFQQVIQTNLGGTATCMMLALERMVPRGQGRIVNVGSFAGIRPAQKASAYSVSKGAARILTQAVVADLAERFPDIVITEWMPGALNTTMGLPHGQSPEIAARWCVTLALMTDRSLNGATFDGDCEHLPPVALKRRLADWLAGRARKPRRIEPLT